MNDDMVSHSFLRKLLEKLASDANIPIEDIISPVKFKDISQPENHSVMAELEQHLELSQQGLSAPNSPDYKRVREVQSALSALTSKIEFAVSEKGDITFEFNTRALSEIKSFFNNKKIELSDEEVALLNPILGGVVQEFNTCSAELLKKKRLEIKPEIRNKVVAREIVDRISIKLGADKAPFWGMVH